MLTSSKGLPSSKRFDDGVEVAVEALRR